MYPIAICDDDPQFSEQAAVNVEKLFAEAGLHHGTDYTITQYGQADALKKALLDDEKACQLLLLDIELEEQNGMELAKQLREKQIDCSLIYLTVHRDYIYDCFETKPLWYLVKPIDFEKLGRIIWEDYTSRIQSARLTLKLDGKQTAIALADIYALEAASHRVCIWQREDTSVWNGSLMSLEQELPSGYFCRCHNSYFINLSHVTKFGRTEVIMDNGASFPVSKRLYAQALNQYFAYLKK